MEKIDVVSFVTRDPLFAEIAAIKDISALSKEERMKYDEGIRKFRDTICVMDYAVEKERYKIARNLLAMGYSKAIVMQATGLSKEDIEKL